LGRIDRSGENAWVLCIFAWDDWLLQTVSISTSERHRQ
jgi:hypothetical protein